MHLSVSLANIFFLLSGFLWDKRSLGVIFSLNYPQPYTLQLNLALSLSLSLFSAVCNHLWRLYCPLGVFPTVLTNLCYTCHYQLTHFVSAFLWVLYDRSIKGYSESK